MVKPEGAVLKLIGATVDVKVEPEIRVTGSLGATMARSSMQAEGRVIPKLVVDAIRTASPKLADEIETRDPTGAKQLVEIFTALIHLLAALVTLYMAQHPASPVTPEHITQLFDQSRHIVNQTTVVNPPPAPGTGH